MAGTRKVFITGGSGRIGNHVVRALVERGHSVVNFDIRRQWTGPSEFIYGNVRNRSEVAAAMRGCEAVIHLAEIPGARVPVAVDEVYWGNACAGAVVMQSAADLKMGRVIYTSSCQVYGCWEENAVPPVRLPFDESHPLQPRNVYALSKVANEGYARLVHESSGMPIAIFRLPRVLPDYLLTPNFVRGMMEDDGPTDGFETYVHASDAARAYVAALDADRPGIEVYNIFAGDIASGIPLRGRLARHHPDYPPLPDNWPDYQSPVSSAKAWEQLHWKADWSFREHASRILGETAKAT